ncbi:MAG: hypothetical protein KGJ84_08545 [Elusimicrobia bacterium]|nr:hypothetical protein [Elusimicrobiota bacterium]
MSDPVDPAVSAQLKIIAGAMGMGIALLCLVIAFLFLQNDHVATPEGLRLINLLTGMAMAGTVVAIMASEILWKSVLSRGTGGAAGRTVVGAFIARSACREGAALLGCVTALLAAMNGVLRAHPAYWVDMAPAVLFWSYLYVHWPSATNLKAEIDQIVKLR